MNSISLIFELVRSRPVAVFWAAALAQALIWTLVPALFYSAPPPAVAELLAVGREFVPGSFIGPPLAPWLAEIAFRGLGAFGVYLLSQVCIVVAYWAVFSLARMVVGDRHAALTVLLMAGVAVFAVPSPEFGPAILAAALWALILMLYWRAIGQGRPGSWIWLGVAAGWLLLTTYVGFLLLALLLAFTLVTRRGREQLKSNAEFWVAGVIIILIFLPHLIWLELTDSVGRASLAEIPGNVRTWGRLVVTLAIGHVGVAILVLLARGLTPWRRRPVAEIDRVAVDPDARLFVYAFALGPALAIGLLALFTSRAENFIAAPLVLLTALAVIVTAPDRLRLAHQRLLQIAWAGLLLFPPLVVVLAVTVLPWAFAVDLRVAQPADDMGRFFAENFERRTGRPLAVVSGDPAAAALIALGAPSRPSLYLYATPERTPWVTRQDIETKGAVVVWPATTTRGVPPPAIQQAFPGLIPELPRAFERRFQGRLTLTRLGWAVIRPAR